MRYRYITSACVGVAAMFAGGCTNWQTLTFSGGNTGGYLRSDKRRFSWVHVEMGSPMAQRTAIMLPNGQIVRLNEITPEFLLRHGSLFRYWDSSREEHRIDHLSGFEPSQFYIVYMGTSLCGPRYRFEVRDSQVMEMAAGWTTDICPNGYVGATFVDQNGTSWETPLTYDTVTLLWGPPDDIQKTNIGGW